MAVNCGNPQWPSLAATHNDIPSRILTMAVPCGNPQWPSLAATHNGRPSRLLTMAVPRGYSQWQSLTQMWTVKNNFGLLHLILFGWLIKKLSCLIIIFPFIIFILPSLGLCSQRRSHHLHHLSHASVASLMDRLNKTTKNFTEYSASHAISVSGRSVYNVTSNVTLFQGLSDDDIDKYIPLCIRSNIGFSSNCVCFCCCQYDNYHHKILIINAYACKRFR